MSDAYEEQIEGFERDMAKLRAALADEQAKRAAAEEDLAAEREAINEIAAEMTGRWIEERDRLMRELAEARAALAAKDAHIATLGGALKEIQRAAGMQDDPNTPEDECVTMADLIERVEDLARTEWRWNEAQSCALDE